MSNRAKRVAIAVVAFAFALVTLTTACMGTIDTHSRLLPTTTTTTVDRLRVVSCDVAATAATVQHLHTATGSVWVWVESSPRPPLHVGALVKVVWRITGRGAPRVVLLGPDGHSARLTFGPELHARSTFRHPGAEYGTGFTPDAPGCWTLTMRRDAVAGSMSFSVA